MKSILTRLRNLESVAAPLDREREIVETIIAARRRRMEANGEPYEEFLPVDLTGCNSIGDQIKRARKAKMKRQEELEELAKQSSVR